VELRRELQLSIAGLIAFQLVTALAGIGLLSRTRPAIEHILSDNVATLAATDEMLAILAANVTNHGTELEFRHALESAEQNITEAREREIVERIRRLATPEGLMEPDAALVEALRDLSEINRDAMRVDDESAQWISSAGAWTIFAFSLLSFGVSLVILYRLRSRLLRPLTNLHQTVLGAKQGDPHRRCTISDAPEELQTLIEVVNGALDHTCSRGGPRRQVMQDRSVALHLLDQLPGATIVVDSGGNITATNQQAMQLMDEAGDDLLDKLREQPTASIQEGDIVTAIRGNELFLHQITT
jgi:nitrogen fixation/metabolism regulation signal transduction histidine kinase